jgi:hypothetical protein
LTRPEEEPTRVRLLPRASLLDQPAYCRIGQYGLDKGNCCDREDHVVRAAYPILAPEEDVPWLLRFWIQLCAYHEDISQHRVIRSQVVDASVEHISVYEHDSLIWRGDERPVVPSMVLVNDGRDQYGNRQPKYSKNAFSHESNEAQQSRVSGFNFAGSNQIADK